MQGLILTPAGAAWSDPQTGPYQAELLAQSRGPDKPLVHQLLTRPSLHIRHIWCGRGQPQGPV